MFTSEELSKVREMVQAGRSVDEIATAFRLSRYALDRRLMASGWKFERPLRLVQITPVKSREEVAA